MYQFGKVSRALRRSQTHGLFAWNWNSRHSFLRRILYVKKSVKQSVGFCCCCFWDTGRCLRNYPCEAIIDSEDYSRCRVLINNKWAPWFWRDRKNCVREKKKYVSLPSDACCAWHNMCRIFFTIEAGLNSVNMYHRYLSLKMMDCGKIIALAVVLVTHETGKMVC